MMHNATKGWKADFRSAPQGILTAVVERILLLISRSSGMDIVLYRAAQAFGNKRFGVFDPSPFRLPPPPERRVTANNTVGQLQNLASDRTSLMERMWLAK